MPLFQTKEANRFGVPVIGHLEVTLCISVYIFPLRGENKKWNIRKNRRGK